MLIFDMDGTLIDSNGIWRQVDEAFLAKRGYPYTREYYEIGPYHFPMAAKFGQGILPSGGVRGGHYAEWMQMAGDAMLRGCPSSPGSGHIWTGAGRRGSG